MDDNLFYPLITIIFCKLLLLIYYSFFIYKYPNFIKIHINIISLLFITIFTNLLLLMDVNIIIYYNGKPDTLLRWIEWFITIYLIMKTISITENKKGKKYLNYNIIAQNLCILFGFFALTIDFKIFSLLSIIVHLYNFYVIKKTYNIFLCFYQAISIMIVIYFFLYYSGYIVVYQYFISMWIFEILIKCIFIIIITINYMITTDYTIQDILNREQIYYIIHDLRIHLNNLTLSMDQIKKTNITKLMNISIKAMIELINQILLFNKINKNLLKFDNDYFSVENLLNEVIDEFSFQLANKKIIHKINIKKNYYIYGDKKWIKKIFINLISNAIKHTKTIINVNITFNKKDDENIIINFSIEDDGNGVQNNYINYLFKAFSKTKYDTDASTGLGLYLTHKIINYYHGNIAYKYNNGAIFYGSFLTKYKEKYIENETNIIHEMKKVKPFIYLNIKKILIVDDSELNRYLLKKVISSIKNYTILEAFDGKNAIEIYKENSDIDLIFMDFHMPYMSGNIVIEKLHELGYKKNIILLTGLMKEDIYSKLDINYILIKPITKKIIETLFKAEKII